MHPLWQSGRQAAAEAASELCRTLAKFPLGNRAGPQPSGRQEAGPGLVTLSLHPEPEPEPTNESNFAKTWTFGPPAVLVLHPSWFTCLALKLHFGVSKSEKETSSLRPAADPPSHASPDTEYRAEKLNLLEFYLFRMMTTTTRETFPHSQKGPRRMMVCLPPRPPHRTPTPPWPCTTPSSTPSDPGPPRADFLRWPAILCRILSVKESTPCQKMP